MEHLLYICSCNFVIIKVYYNNFAKDLYDAFYSWNRSYCKHPLTLVYIMTITLCPADDTLLYNDISDILDDMAFVPPTTNIRKGLLVYKHEEVENCYLIILDGRLERAKDNNHKFVTDTIYCY